MRHDDRSVQRVPASNAAAAAALTAARISTGRVSAMEATAGYPLVQGHARGVRITDVDGKDYIDCRSAGGVFNLGHRPSVITELLHQAIEEHDAGDWMLLSAVRARAADAIARAAPAGLDHVQFAVTGTEAIEAACKLARGTTGQPKIVIMHNCYHGSSGFGLAAQPLEDRGDFEPLTQALVQVPHGDLAAAREVVDDDTAAVLLEVVQGGGGVMPPPDGYMQGLRDLCDATGALMICDEVQAGMGRTGRLFSFEHWDVEPDLVVIAKALGGAYFPISACLFNERVYAYACANPMTHPSTFGGAELGCRVAERTIELMSDPALLTNVRERGAQLADGYTRLHDAHPGVIEGFRQIGLFTGLDTPDPKVAASLRHAAVRNGLIAFTAPFRQRCLQIWPPLVITAAEVSELLERLSAAVAEVATNP